MSDSVNEQEYVEGDADSEAEFHAQGGHYSVGKRDYAWGLVWDIPHLDETEKVSVSKVAKIAREAAHSMHGDLYLATETQYAIGSTQAGHVKGMRSVALSLMTVWGDSFIAVLKTRDGEYYLLAVQEGVVIPGSDIHTFDEDDARAFVSTRITEGDTEEWGRIVAPADFGLSNSQEENLDEVLKESKSSARLKDATVKNTIRNIVIGLVVAGIVGGLYYGYTTYEARVLARHQEQQRLEAAQRAQAMKQKQMEEARNSIWPWDGAVIGQYALAECDSAMQSVSTILPGYTFENMVCTPKDGTVVLKFRQDADGSFATVADSVNMMTTMRPHIRHFGSEIEITYDFSPLFANSKFTRHNEYGDVNAEWKWLDIKTSLEHVDNIFHMSVASPSAKTKGTKAVGGIQSRLTGSPQNGPVDRMVFRKLDISVASRYEVMDWMPFVAPLKAFVVDSVTYGPPAKSGGKGDAKAPAPKMGSKAPPMEWSFTGTAYEGVMQSEIDNPGKPAMTRSLGVPVQSGKDVRETTVGSASGHAMIATGQKSGVPR